MLSRCLDVCRRMSVNPSLVSTIRKWKQANIPRRLERREEEERKNTGSYNYSCRDNIGKLHFASVQAATAFASTFPHIFGTDPKKSNQVHCLIPCAIDQDPYFRLCRDVAVRLKYPKPALIHAQFFPALQGPGSKMSASVDTSAIFMTDTAKIMYVY